MSRIFSGIGARGRAILRALLAVGVVVTGIATGVAFAQTEARDGSGGALVSARSAGQPSAREAALADPAAPDPATPALCPIVYPNDETPASRGYHYTFFGNAFFINEQGYLLTVAHVLETFRDGGQPFILVNRHDAPPQLLKASIVARDAEHDVAILRATPNPFGGRFDVAFVPLASEPVVRGEEVLALSLHPKKTQDAHSFEYQREDSSAGTVLAIESTQLQKAGPPAEIFLLSHPVVKGQSGSPVLDRDSHAAVGLIEGLWLRGTTVAKSSALPTDAPGAAIPIRYATSLLEQNHVAWTAALAKAPHKSTLSTFSRNQ